MRHKSLVIIVWNSREQYMRKIITSHLDNTEMPTNKAYPFLFIYICDAKRRSSTKSASSNYYILLLYTEKFYSHIICAFNFVLYNTNDGTNTWKRS